jgi:hypothetical protein
METSLEVPQIIKVELPFDVTTLLLGIYLKEFESTYNKDTCTHMIIEELFTSKQ